MIQSTVDHPIAESPANKARNLNDSAVLFALQEYGAARKAGEAPNRQAILAQFPDLVAELQACLDALDFIHTAASQLRSAPSGLMTAQAEELDLTSSLGDFRILREIGRGGMGIVYEAEQISLKRRVALKMLPFASMLDSRQLQRFKNEAQAAACLHHTNIVPVFATGVERGVHFYAMQFIEGHTLAEVIDGLRLSAIGHRPDEEVDDGRPKADSRKPTAAEETAKAAMESTLRSFWPKADSRKPTAEFYRTVAELGIQAAEALEYAHQMGIVHRDVKPANLLLDSSPLPPTGGEGPGVRGANCPRLWITDFGLAQVQSENTRLTMSGDLLGTLRYMSPEQALGNRVIVDHRTDIYSLGVTLYELLTLQPVFNGKDRQEVLRQIAFEEPKPPRRLDKHIPAELETIILKAMERRPEERYAMAGELAADLRRWLMHEPIRARSPSLLERGRKWARRHRAWVNAAAVVLVIAFAASVASATLIWQEKEQKAAALQAKETALQQAEARTQFARDAADGFYTEVAETWLKGQPQLTEVQRTFLLKALRFYEELANEKSADPTIRWETARANRRAAEIHSNLGENARAEEHYGRAIRLLDELKAEFPSEPRYRLSLAETCRKFGLFLKDPNQLLTEESNGLLKRNPARPQEAEAALRRALGLFQALELEAPGGRVYRRGQMACLSNLGNLLRDTNRLHEAVQAYRQARDVCLKLAADYPDIPPHADPDKNVELLMAAGRYKEAEDRIREAGFDEEELKVGFPELEKVQHNWAITLHALGLAIAAQNRPKEAVEYFRRSRAFYEKLVAEFPAMPKYQFDLAGCCSNLGAMLARSGQPKEAEEAWRHAVVVLEPLDAKDPKARQMLADCYLYLAYQLKSPDRTGDFQQVLRRAVALFEKLGSISPQSLTIRERLAEACNMLAWSLCTCADPQLRHPQQAVELAKRAIELATQGQVGDYWNTLGTAHYRAGVWQCAVAALEESRKARSGGDSDDFFFLAMAHWQLGDKDKAREWYDKAVQWMEKNKPNDEELRGFREEAAKLLGVKDQKQ